MAFLFSIFFFHFTCIYSIAAFFQAGIIIISLNGTTLPPGTMLVLSVCVCASGLTPGVNYQFFVTAKNGVSSVASKPLVFVSTTGSGSGSGSVIGAVVGTLAAVILLILIGAIITVLM